MNRKKIKLLISSLEPSANLHLGEILEGEEFEIVGIFDEKFGNPLYSSREFSVMGFFDVLPKIFKAKEAIKELSFLSKSCDKVLLIDAPSFNIPLAKEIKKINPNIEIIYYILPKVWAWKKGRIKTINKYVDKKAYIFPFEKEYWGEGYVGNPLLDEIQTFRDNKIYNQVAFLAGSRKSEIKSLIPIFREIAKRIDVKKVLVVPKIYKDNLDIYGDISDFEISFDTVKTLLKSDFAYICSGTATLEAAIIGTPFVLMYKARKIEYFIAKQFVQLNYVGLANIIFEKEGLGEFHKEYLQEFDIETLIKDYKNIELEEWLLKSKKIREILKFGSKENIKGLIKQK
jgi:lipid-A-disaccharide synthase